MWVIFFPSFFFVKAVNQKKKKKPGSEPKQTTCSTGQKRLGWTACLIKSRAGSTEEAERDGMVPFRIIISGQRESLRCAGGRRPRKTLPARHDATPERFPLTIQVNAALIARRQMEGN